nr:NADH dehydrogenase [ubiquinone] iron-sulfur protein 2 [Tanacetum cinerariifolium]
MRDASGMIDRIEARAPSFPPRPSLCVVDIKRVHQKRMGTVSDRFLVVVGTAPVHFSMQGRPSGRIKGGGGGDSGNGDSAGLGGALNALMLSQNATSTLMLMKVMKSRKRKDQMRSKKRRMRVNFVGSVAASRQSAINWMVRTPSRPGVARVCVEVDLLKKKPNFHILAFREAHGAVLKERSGERS